MRVKFNILVVVFLFAGLLAIQLFFIFKTWDHTANRLETELGLIVDNVYHNAVNDENFKDLLQSASNNANSETIAQLNNQLETYAVTGYFDVGEISFEIYNNRYSDQPTDFLLNNVEYTEQHFNALKAHHLCLTCVLENNYENKDAYLELGALINDRTRLQISELWLPILLSFLFLVLLSVFSIIILRKWATAQQLNIQKNGFINNLSHELKTPIFSIQLFSQLIIEMGQNSTLDEYGKRIKIEALHLEKQIHRILESTGLESEDLIRFSKIELNGFLLEMQPALQLLCEHHSSAFEFNPLKGKICLIKADEIHLKNVVNALVDNAIKYGKENPKVSLKVLHQNDHYIIEIKDKGIGIPDKEKRKVLEKFYRVNMSDTSSISGFGLGLFYANEATKKMNGSLQIRNNSPQGTIVSLRFKAVI